MKIVNENEGELILVDGISIWKKLGIATLIILLVTLLTTSLSKDIDTNTLLIVTVLLFSTLVIILLRTKSTNLTIDRNTNNLTHQWKGIFGAKTKVFKIQLVKEVVYTQIRSGSGTYAQIFINMADGNNIALNAPFVQVGGEDKLGKHLAEYLNVPYKEHLIPF